jgi:EAL domain-containing protein (putative c-di-GMP-specific phosphodiesterase class I)
MQRIVELNHAFDEDRFVLYQQPILSLNPEKDGHEHFCEVLVRMLDEDGFPVLPANFLSTSERYNLATQLDTWVVNNTLDWMASDPEVRCTINLSGMSIADEGFLGFMLHVIDEKRVYPNRICLEITETAAIQNLTRTESVSKLPKPPRSRTSARRIILSINCVIAAAFSRWTISAAACRRSLT